MRTPVDARKKRNIAVGKIVIWNIGVYTFAYIPFILVCKSVAVVLGMSGDKKVATGVISANIYAGRF